MSVGLTVNQWLIRYGAPAGPQLRLFCFPYAGATVQIFRHWPVNLPANVAVYALQLPGRGGRLKEPPFSDLPPLVAAAAPSITPYLDRPFALYGHSMGALIAFELARYLRRNGYQLPARMFVAACRAPQTDRPERPTYNLPDQEFLEELRHLNGTPQEVMDHPELLELRMPLLRADFAVAQTYKYQHEPPLSCPVTAVGGVEDSGVSEKDLEAWSVQTNSGFNLYLLPGDHFFINTRADLLLEIIRRELATVI